MANTFIIWDDKKLAQEVQKNFLKNFLTINSLLEEKQIKTLQSRAIYWRK